MSSACFCFQSWNLERDSPCEQSSVPERRAQLHPYRASRALTSRITASHDNVNRDCFQTVCPSWHDSNSPWAPFTFSAEPQMLHELQAKGKCPPRALNNRIHLPWTWHACTNILRIFPLDAFEGHRCFRRGPCFRASLRLPKVAACRIFFSTSIVHARVRILLKFGHFQPRCMSNLHVLSHCPRR